MKVKGTIRSLFAPDRRGAHRNAGRDSFSGKKIRSQRSVSICRLGNLTSGVDGLSDAKKKGS